MELKFELSEDVFNWAMTSFTLEQLKGIREEWVRLIELPTVSSALKAALTKDMKKLDYIIEEKRKRETNNG
jgi:hypothetical protein